MQAQSQLSPRVPQWRPCRGRARAAARPIGFLLCALAAVLTGCSRGPQDGPPGGANPPGRGRAMAVPVTVARAAQQDVPVEVGAIGTVRAHASISVKARVDGELAKVNFKQGDEVKLGDRIFLIDDRPFQAALAQAEALLARDRAALENAETDMRRTDELAGTKAVPATLVDANRSKVAGLRASVEADRAAVRTATLQLSFCTISSPVNGRIGLLAVDEGNMVKNNDTILAVVNQIRPIYVDFAVPERLVQDVRDAAALGQLRVEAATPQHPEQRAVGTLAAINNQVDSATGTLLLRAEFPNSDERLWPGQFVNVQLVLGRLTNAIVVPSPAIQSSQDGEFVFVVRADGSVEKRLVTLGPIRDRDTVIVTGLQAGETVVTDGQLRLVPGAKVDIRTPGQPADGQPAAEKAT